MSRRGLAALALAGNGCSAADDTVRLPAPGTLLAEPTAPLPDTIAELGLHPDPADRRTVVDLAIAYAPRWPLWSSGSDKSRWLAVPAGETIDNRVRDAWVYPAGTIFFKTFADGPTPIETRVLRKQADQRWALASYQWNDQGTDGTRLDGDFEVVVPLAAGGQHTIPNTLMCRECHESAPDPVLGDSELQLSEAIDDGPSALAVLASAGLLREPAPANPRRVREHAEDPQTHAVLGDWVGNCVPCHNGTDGPSSSFDLDPAVALRNTIGVDTESSASAAGIRIDPGSTATSILFLAVSGEHEDPEVEPMPPVAIDARDQAMVERLRAFIEGLP